MKTWDRDGAEYAKIAWIRPHIQLQNPENLRCVLKTIELCSKKFRASDTNKEVFQEPNRVISRRAEPPFTVREAASAVHDTISSKLDCDCELRSHTLTANFGISTYRGLNHFASECAFDLVFYLDDAIQSPKEARVTSRLDQ